MSTLRLPVLFLGLLVLAPGCTGDVEGDEAGECTDGGDNDGDGDFDCDDSDCQASPDCQTTDGPTTETTTTSTETTTSTNTHTTWVNCDGDILEFFPPDGDNQVYYRTTVDFTFDELLGPETITLSQNGATVAGNTVVIDNRLVFTPSSPLAPNTTYDVELNWCHGPTALSWTTSEVGSATNGPSLVGNTYGLDIGSGRFVEPPGVGSLISGLLESEILMGVTNVSAGDIEFLGALSDGGTGQDMCSASFPMPVTDFTENPYFSAQSPVLVLDVTGLLIEVEDFEISGAFAPDGSYIGGTTFGGVMDVRFLEDLVGGDACDLFATFGVSCQPCPSGSISCLDLFVDSIHSPQKNGLTLVPITANDVANNPNCN